VGCPEDLRGRLAHGEERLSSHPRWGAAASAAGWGHVSSDGYFAPGHADDPGTGGQCFVFPHGRMCLDGVTGEVAFVPFHNPFADPRGSDGERRARYIHRGRRSRDGASGGGAGSSAGRAAAPPPVTPSGGEAASSSAAHAAAPPRAAGRGDGAARGSGHRRRGGA